MLISIPWEGLGISRSRLLSYLGAVGIVALATVLRMTLHVVLLDRLPFTTHFLSVVIVAWLWGLGPAVLATALAFLLADYYFLPPYGAFKLGGSTSELQLLVGVLIALFSAYLISALRDARDKAARSAQESEAAARSTRDILERIGDGFFAFDREWRFLYVNENGARLARRTREELLGKKVWEGRPEGPASEFYLPLHRAMTDQVRVQFESYYAPFDTWFEISAYPTAEGISVFARDVTARKRDEETRLYLSAIVESSDDAIIGKSLDGTIVSWNPGAQKLYGYKPEEVIGKNIDVLVPSNRMDEMPGIFERLRRGEAIAHYETERLRKDGLRLYVSLTVSPIRRGGRIIGASAVARDITERKRAEGRFQQAVESAPNAMVMVNHEGRIVLANTQTEKLFGYRQDELMGQSIDILVPARFRLRHPEYRKDFFAEPRARPMGAGRDLYGLRKDGTEFPVEIGLNPIETEEGTWVLSAIVDITERKRVEEETGRLLEREQEARRLAERAAERTARIQMVTAALSASLTATQVVRVVIEEGISALGGNAGLVATLGPDGEPHLLNAVNYPPQVIEAWRNAQVSIWETPLGDALRRQEPLLMESVDALISRYPHLDKVSPGLGLGARAAIPLLVHGRATGAMWLSFPEPRVFTDEDKNLLAILAQLCAEALERARLFEAEQAARAAAESTNRLKDEFLATLSHELRTPLTAILGWSRMLESGGMDATLQQKGVQTIARNAKAQAQLIDDILDVSRIITGKLRLGVQPVELPRVIEASMESVQPAAESKGVRLQKIIDPRAGPVLGDAERLQQVCWNLLSNAIKFTPRGGRVSIALQRINSHLEITVSDTGIGIRQDFLPHVFERFRQADSSTTRVHGGLGLGLAIVRHLVEMHGGTVQADSPGEGGGATFTVRLPLPPVSYVRRSHTGESERVHPAADAAADVPRPPRRLEGVRVLVVDDEAETRELLSAVLAHSGAVVSAVASAAEAVQAIEQRRPEILIADIGMPDEDGYALIRHVRAVEKAVGRAPLPAIALTAYARVQDRIQALDAGYQLHSAKPVEPAELVLSIAGLLGRTGTP